MCTLIAILLSMDNCVPPDPRPRFNDLWVTYGPIPDCINGNRHIRYLNKLKTMPMRSDDTVGEIEYNNAVDLYIEHLETLCNIK